MTEDRKQSIIAKVRALLAKTTDQGCTEAEAASAAELASKLMVEYDLDIKSVSEIREETYGARKRPFATGNGRRRAYHEVQNCLVAIARYFDCDVWMGKELVFFGTATDTEMAHAMTDMMKAAMESEWRRMQNIVKYENPRQHGKSLRTSFMLGMARRISERLRDLKAERTAISNQTELKGDNGLTVAPGTSLVVVKDATRKEKLVQYKAQSGLKIAKRYTSSTIRSSSAYGRGKEAGGRVSINSKIAN